ncbi:MAG TPA: serine/threonine-protein kinase [Polyangiaceae bacterium]|nr:serine/threonine-protein kinase [Polyangiaceae bacterium]
MSAPLVNAGTILAGRWQIQDFIGSGETGEVYGVRDMHSTGTFALKLFWPNALGHSELWSAVQQTARTASGLGVDGVARTHDFGIDANSGRPFYVAERVAWSSLADRLRLRGPLTPAEMASAFSVLARALDAAHGIGLVHRDLKPENVFVAPENPNWVRISDFGVALLRAASPPPPGWGGTVGWVAPDAADLNARSTPAMDVFALGLLTFFALSGGPLHRAARVNPIDPNALWQELGAPLDSASLRARELGASIDPAFDPWFQRAVSPNPQARFTSVGEMAGAFEAIARTLIAPQSPNAVALEGVAAAIAQPLIFQPESLPSPATARSAEPAATPPTVQSAQYAPASEVATPPLKKRNSAPLFIGGAVICFGLTALGATALYRHHQAANAEASAEVTLPATASVVSAAVLPSSPPPLPTASAAPAPTTSSASPPAAAAAPVAEAAPAPTPTPSVAASKASTTPPAVKAPLVTPGATASKAAGTSGTKPTTAASATPSAAVASKPAAPATTAATAKAKPGTLSAPKKKCGSVFLPCK